MRRQLLSVYNQLEGMRLETKLAPVCRFARLIEFLGKVMPLRCSSAFEQLTGSVLCWLHPLS